MRTEPSRDGTSISRIMAGLFRAVAVRLQRAGPTGFSACLLLVGLLTGCTPSANDQSKLTVHPSVMIPFEELFALEDTLVLDPSVIVGRIWFMDADASGSVLITDIAANEVYLFANTGQHQATYSVDTCLPDGEHGVWMSRFADGDRVIVATGEGAMAVFDRSGNCLAASRRLITPLQSFCSHGDSIFTFRGPRGMNLASTSIMGAYSMDLELEREILLEDPEFYRLNLTEMGSVGRNMDCFSDGPYYKYHEDMDARPAHRRSQMVMSRPDFFVQRDQDVSGEPMSRERRESTNAFPRLIGLYALDDDTRMMMFRDIGGKFHPEGVRRQSVAGLSIVSTTKKFRSVSTVLHKKPYTARHGYLYYVGDIAQTDDGGVGNPTVIRYRFKAPEATDD